MPLQSLRPISWSKSKGFHYSKNGTYIRRFEAENLRGEVVNLEFALEQANVELLRYKTVLRNLKDALEGVG